MLIAAYLAPNSLGVCCIDCLLNISVLPQHQRTLCGSGLYTALWLISIIDSV